MAQREVLKISGKEEGLALVKRNWTDALASLTGVIIMDTSALAQVIGASSEVLRQLRDHGKKLILLPTGTDEWSWSMQSIKPSNPTLRQSYIGVYERACQQEAQGRPEVASDLQQAAVLLFEQLPLSQRTEMRDIGKSPDMVVRHVNLDP